jgi:oligogalacturonide lyase
MKRFFSGGLCFALLTSCALATSAQENSTKQDSDSAAGQATSDAKVVDGKEPEPPTEWIEPQTGHRVVRLSREPGTASFYFHQNAYANDKLVVSTPEGLSTINLKTREIVPIVQSRAGNVIVGKKSGNVYYTQEGVAYSTNVDTKETRKIAKLPFRAGGFALNADETLLGGGFIEGSNPLGAGDPTRGGDAGGKGREGNTGDRDLRRADARRNADSKSDKPIENASLPQPADTRGGDRATQQNLNTFSRREGGLGARLAQKLPMKLYTINIQTGDIETYHPSTDWLNHFQFSPSDPELFMFAHEGPWHDVDRIWTVRVGSNQSRLMHNRTVKYEIAGHEFFGHDGKMIWYDLQTPRSDTFWLAGVNVYTGDRVRYPLERSQWSVHYNESHDGKLFCGDGGGPGSVANRTPLPDNQPLDPPGNGMWLYLFTPDAAPTETMQVGGETVKIGRFKAEKLVDMSKHNYELEPNLTFTPDNKWLVFRSNMHGPSHVYAVEVAKAAN